MRVFFQLGTAISLAWIAVPAAAQTSDPNVRTCVDKSGDEAIAGCTAAITSGKLSTANLAAMFFNRGNAYKHQNEFARAIADYTEAIRLNPQFAAAFLNRGIVYLKQANWAAAFADFETTSRLVPNAPFALYGRGLAALHLGKAAEGQADIAAATKADPSVAKVYADEGLIP